MASSGTPLVPLNPHTGLSVSSSSLTGANTIATTGPIQLSVQQGNHGELMMATNVATSSSTSPTPSDSTSVSAESGKSALAGIISVPS